MQNNRDLLLLTDYEFLGAGALLMHSSLIAAWESGVIIKRDFHSNGHGSITRRQRWLRTFEFLFQNWQFDLTFGREIGGH